MEINCKACGKPVKIKPGRQKPEGHLCRSCYHTLPRPNRKTGVTKQCEICGKEFYAKAVHADQRFCSLACKGIGSRLAIKSCVVCGKEFKPLMGRSAQPCCSRECGYIYRQDRRMKTCAQCGKEFYLVNSQFDIIKCCSSDCTSKWMARNKTIHFCKMCGKEFRWSPSRTQSGKYNPTYCSLPCRDSDPERREMLIGMNAMQQRLTPNKVERIGYGLLDELQLEYLPQHLIAKKFCVDAFIPSLNTVVQFDGDYWHCNPAFFSTPDSRQQKRMRLDISQDAYMKACGYTVIRIWASDLEKHLESVKTRLQSLLVPAQHTLPAQE